VRRTLVWTGLDAVRSEVAQAAVAEDGALHAWGSQIGAGPQPYELRYEVDGTKLAIELAGGPYRTLDLDGADFFDLGFSPLFNSFPILRDGLHAGGAARDYVMAWVRVPTLEVERSEQRYEPVRPGVVRFVSGAFTAELEIDEDGFVLRYPGLAERVARVASPE
jgi:Putative glycolipid-binding